MKNLILIFSIAAIFSCKKETTTPTLNCKLIKKISNTNGGNKDTSIYTYTGDDISIYYHKEGVMASYVSKYIKSGDQYLYELYNNGTKTIEGFEHLNSQGLIDTSRSTYIPTMAFNNRNKYYFDTEGNAIRSILNYTIYENDYKYYYSNGNYDYAIYDFTHFTIPANTRKDSIVYEYYLDKPKLIGKTPLEAKYGKLVKNLEKKRSYYDLLNSGNLRQTYEYEYLTDAKGLVTREIWIIRDQPGNTESRRDTSYYEYSCN